MSDYNHEKITISYALMNVDHKDDTILIYYLS